MQYHGSPGTSAASCMLPLLLRAQVLTAMPSSQAASEAEYQHRRKAKRQRQGHQQQDSEEEDSENGFLRREEQRQAHKRAAQRPPHRRGAESTEDLGAQDALFQDASAGADPADQEPLLNHDWDWGGDAGEELGLLLHLSQTP